MHFYLKIHDFHLGPPVIVGHINCSSYLLALPNNMIRARGRERRSAVQGKRRGDWGVQKGKGRVRSSSTFCIYASLSGLTCTHDQDREREVWG